MNATGPISEICRRDGCDRPRTKYSAFCDEHHTEMLASVPSPPAPTPRAVLSGAKGLTIGDLAAVLRDALPTLESIDDCLDPARLDGWLDSCDGDIVATERVMNHVHMTDALGSLDWSDPFDAEDLVTFAQIYASALRDLLVRQDIRLVL